MFKCNPKKITRSDGEQSRERLLKCAVKLFAEQGYAKTSTREIAKSALANISAIAYYFGDKAGLYRAVFTETFSSPRQNVAVLNDTSLSLEEAFNGLFNGFIEPFKHGELVKLRIKLHMREMLEPAGLWEEEIDNSIKPHLLALNELLCRHLNLAETDDDIRRLSISIVAMGVYMFVGQDVMGKVSPQLINTHEALDTMKSRLTMFALSMVQAEVARREQANNEQSNEKNIDV